MGIFQNGVLQNISINGEIEIYLEFARFRVEIGII
jgi:hypothetical protein